MSKENLTAAFISFAIHLSLLIIFLSINFSQKTKVIDLTNISFSFEEKQQNQQIKQEEIHKEKEIIQKKIQKIVEKPKIKEEKQKTIIPENPKVENIPQHNENKTPMETIKSDISSSKTQSSDIIETKTQNITQEPAKIQNSETPKNTENNNPSNKKRFSNTEFAIIKDIIQKNITYPILARKMGWEGEVLIKFKLCKNGEVHEITVEKSSGYQILDDNAIKTIKSVSYLFPKPDEDIYIKIPIVYRLD